MKIEIELPDDEVADAAAVKQEYFVIEVLDLSKMPHAAHVFLEQVNHDLWNGMELVMSSPSTLLVDPVAASSNADSINQINNS